jgi:hypothetical protein
VDVCAVIDKVLVFLDPELKKTNVEVQAQCPQGLMVRGDSDLIYRAFYNVLSNAAQAMEQGGVIRVEAAQDTLKVRVSFIDSGPGFDPETIEKITDPFFTTKDSGTGLGLAIVANIVSSHGGEIRLQNQEGAGARVDIEFPKA